jgi:dTDP-4-amino-4,6-dideoxygalactose transaminase
MDVGGGANPMKIPLFDLVAQYQSIRDEIEQTIQGVLESGVFILGPNVAAFEAEIAAYLGVRYAVGVASGTDALLLTLRAYGVGPGDEVIVPAYTFFATAEVVSQVGATPVFVDIDPRTYCLDVKQLEAKISARTKAIIPVHLYGHPADMAPILELAKKHGLKVIEDNAQALGAEYKGRKTGSLGDAGCLSFFPSKTLGGYGDGGMVVTNDPTLAETVRKLRTHGWRTKYYPEMIGYNSRLDELQAAILRVKLRHLDAWNERRRKIAEQYRALLAGNGIELPWEAPYARHVYHLYVIRVKEREAVQERLKAMGIASAVYYPLPLHLVEPYRDLGYGPGAFPEAERAAKETLAIPLYPEMTSDQIETVASGVRDALVEVESRR